MLPRALLTDTVFDSVDVERQILHSVAEIERLDGGAIEDVEVQGRDCEAILNTYLGPITADLIAQLPKCKIIARYGIGVDTIDVDAATQAGIIVTNNPTYCVDEVADHAMALVLAAARKVVFYDRAVRAGEWAPIAGKPIKRLRGVTIGLVGYGNIARQVAARAAGFGMDILFSDPFVSADTPNVIGRKVELDELLVASDIISLHPPLNAATRGMFNQAVFEAMKRSAILVNVSRGGLVDMDALVAALDKGLIAGCALDTFETEPLQDDHPLRGRENVILTPHAAWYSEDALELLHRGAPSEVRRVLTGEWPIHVVNPAVRGRTRAGL
ncbi:MAG: hypothetical protein RLZZ444_4044 [Pseudomonadota bacterium]